MSHKCLDKKNRWRNKTVGFRMSPEEFHTLDVLARLSGLTKQDYIIRRVLNREITINPNPRVYKALRNELNLVAEQLKRLSATDEDDELLDLTAYILKIIDEIKGEFNEDGKEKSN